MPSNGKILLIITGSIAAYKSLDLIRTLKKNSYDVMCVMTKSAAEFITPLSVASISQSKVFTDVFSLQDETEMGHIKLSRDADLVIIAPASADILGKMANGLANDLASTILLATNKPVLVAPAMNVCMWQNKAVKRNVTTLKNDGIKFIGPVSGDLACGENGDGRFSEVEDIFTAIKENLK